MDGYVALGAYTSTCAVALSYQDAKAYLAWYLVEVAVAIFEVCVAVVATSLWRIALTTLRLDNTSLESRFAWRLVIACSSLVLPFRYSLCTPIAATAKKREPFGSSFLFCAKFVITQHMLPSL